MLSINFLKALTAAALLVFFSAFNLYAQDARVSQYNAIPLVVNPAQTGDFEGKLRVLGLGARVNNVTAHNYIYNLSADLNLGKSENWAVGLNYMRSGASSFPVHGNYFGASVARRFFLDKAGLQQLRLGAQASYLTGGVDMTKSGYDRLLDVSAFRYLNRAINSGNTATTSYLNYSVGAKYKIEIGRLKIETGFSAYNITNPNHNLNYQGVNTLLKRYRVAALSGLQYQFSDKDAVRVEHYSWKEGIFLRDYKPQRDTVEIHETTYSLTWLHKVKNNTLSLGVYSRSWQSVYGVAAINLSDRVGISASYEVPMLKTYYDVAHVELGLSFYPFRKKSTLDKKTAQFKKQVTAITPIGVSLCPPCDSIKVSNQAIVAAKEKADSVKTEVKAPMPLVPLSTNSGNAILFVDTVYYHLDKYNIRPDAQLKLNQISRLMKRLDLTLDVRSHTDLRASVAYNKKLSERRADAVKTYLSALGVNPAKIEVSWFGKKEPINNCISCIDSLQEKNRRSELVLKGFNEQNLQKIIDERLFGPEVTNKEELELKLKQLLSLEDKLEAGLTTATSAMVADNKYYTIQVTKLPAQNETSALDLRWLNMFSEKNQEGYRKYFYGIFLNKDQAQKALEKLQQIGFKDASIKEVGLFLN